MNVFGLSLRDEAHCAALLPRLPEFCRQLEVPGSALDSISLRRAVSDRCAEREAEWGVRDLIDANLARRLAEEGESLRFEALRKFESRARAALATGAAWASIDLDAGRAVVDVEYARRVVELACQLCGIAERIRRDWPLYIPVRIPAPGEAAEPSKLLKFLHALPLPQLRLVFELHPHEPGALAWNGLEKLRFHSRFWRIRFLPASGNKLAPGALSRFLDAGDLPPEPLRILFSPEGASAADDYTMEQLSETAEKWGDKK